MKHFLLRLIATTLIIITSACISNEDIPSEIIDYEEKKLEWGTIQRSGEFNTLPVESEFTTIKLWETTAEGDYAFNHFSKLYEYNKRIFAMWMSHHYDEHGPGQTLRWTYSDDFGVTWEPVSYLFEPLDDISLRLSERTGRYINPVGFAELSDGLYAVGEVMDHYDLDTAPVGAIVRKINSDATLGDIYWGWTNAGDKVAPTPVAGYPEYPFDETNWAEIKTWFTTPGNRPASHGATSVELESRIAINIETNTHYYDRSGQFTEQSDARTIDGGFVRLWRAFGYPGDYRLKRKVFAQYSSNGINYNSPPAETTLPSPRALHTIRNINGNLVVIGNPENHDVMINRDPLYMYIIDPLTLSVKPENIYTLRANGSAQRFPGDFKGGIFSYPHFIKMSNGKIGVTYTTYGKEDIEFSTFNLPQLQ